MLPITPKSHQTLTLLAPVSWFTLRYLLILGTLVNVYE